MKTLYVLLNTCQLRTRPQTYLIISMAILSLSSCAPISYPNLDLQEINPWAIALVVALLFALGLFQIRHTILKKQVDQAIQEANDAADLATLVKREFLSNVSHELRTPLNALMGVIYLAEGSELSPFDAELLEQLKSATGKLNSIIDTILDFNSLQNGQLEFTTTHFNLLDLVNKISDKYASKAYEKGLQINFETMPDVPRNLIGNPDRLGQALSHLIENAIKFTAQGEINIAVDKVEEQKASITLNFRVSDTGVGMTEEESTQIFQPFTQLDGSATRRHGGLGMGLILTKQIVEKMGGKIQVESQTGEGSTFSFMVMLGRVSEADTTINFDPESESEITAGHTIPKANREVIALNPDLLTPIFAQLSNYLQENNTLALSTLKELRKNIPTPKYQPDLKELQRLITLYEFDEAQEILTQLIGQIDITLEGKESNSHSGP